MSYLIWKLIHVLGVILFVGNFPILGTGWIFWSIVLLTISGVAFMRRVAPLQRRMHALAAAGAQVGKLDWPGYQVLSRSWNIWGMVALVAPAVAVVLMVLKPALPAP